MTIPRREWNDFLVSAIERLSNDNAEETKAKWTDNHYGVSYVGDFTEEDTPPKLYWSWKTLFFPNSGNFELVESMDKVHKFGVEYQLSLIANTAGVTQLTTLWQAQKYPADPLPSWGRNTVTGKYRNGVDDWDHYPPYGGNTQGDPSYPNLNTLPQSYEGWVAAWAAGAKSFDDSPDLFKNGVVFYWANYDVATPFPEPEMCKGIVTLQKLKVQYFNCIVNSMSRYIVPPAGGVPLVLYGVGFDPDETEWEYTWNAEVDKISLIGKQGQGTKVLTFAGGDFTRDSDNQITILSTPALAPGTYRIEIEKTGLVAIGDVISYAGQYRCHVSDNPAIDGLVYDGNEFLLFVSDLEDRTPREGDPIVLTDWQLKDKLDLSFVDRSYSPKDVCCTEKFYDGRLQEISGLKRAVNDETGVFISSDMTAKLVNVDKEFSKLLAQYYFKNEPVEMFLAFQHYPESLKTQFFKGFIEDHSLEGGEFDVAIRDLTTVFFQRKVPFYRITKDKYPLAHDSAIGRPMQEAVGNLSYIATEASGAMEAFYINTSEFIYLASRGSLHAITQVYKDGALVDPADYAIVYADGGRTYIDFTTDQGDSKITYNCEGYIYEAWNSVNGYVQHPVYVFLFYLMLIVGLPINYVDFESFEQVKDILTDLDPAIETSGYLGLMEEQDAMTVVQEFCQTIGGSLFPDRYGRLKLAMKDVSNISTSKIIFSGLDTINQPRQDWNLPEAVNRAKVQWNYIPAASRYLQSKEEEREDAVNALSGKYQEAQQPLQMKWTTNETLADKQLFNILYKRGKGLKRIKIKLPLSFVDYLDIYDSFRLQDPFGVSLDGSGDYGRFLYVESIQYEWIGNTMDVDALDLTYILRQYLVLGDEYSLPSNWSLTTEESKAYAYLCDEATGLFADGDYGKILVDENKIAM